VRYHFTGKERDAESGNDYFGARYYASSMGRFMSPDWSSNPVSIPFARLDNPQSLNRYSYVGNNPLSHFDPYGHLGCPGGATQDVACLVQAGWNALKNFFSGGGSNSSQQGSVTTQQIDNLSGLPGANNAPRTTRNLFAGAIPNHQPDFYSASLQFGILSRSISYVPKTNNLFYGPSGAAPPGAVSAGVKIDHIAVR
jgi:RHS repeat-associated protein